MTDEQAASTPPVPDKAGLVDTALAGLHALLSSIPGLTVGAGMLWQHIQPPLIAKQIAWMNSLAAKVDELQQRGTLPDLATLATNPAFVAALMQAGTSVQRTALDAKRKHLRNAVLNTAIGALHLTDDRREILLQCIDNLQPSHLAVLRFCEAPTMPPGTASASWRHIVESALPELRKEGMLELLLQDLVSRGLVQNFSSGSMMTSQGLLTSRTTSLGNDLLALIREPD